MGQLVAVTEKPSATPGVVRFELNRTLSGQGHERFRSVLDAYGPSPSDELARLLFSTGKVAGVHVYANIVTVDLEKGYDSDGLADLVRDMYQYWKVGVEPPTFEDLQPEEAAAGGTMLPLPAVMQRSPRRRRRSRCTSWSGPAKHASAGTPSSADRRAPRCTPCRRCSANVVRVRRVPAHWV